MKIGQYNIPGLIKAYETQTKAREAKNVKQDAVRAETDSLELSPEMREFQQYRAALARMPGVREEKVAALSREIQDGTYRIDPEKILQGMENDRQLDGKGSV